MPASNSTLLHRACINALLTSPEVSYTDAHYLYGIAPLGTFRLDNTLDELHQGARNPVHYLDHKRLIEEGRSCINIRSEVSNKEYAVLYPEDLVDCRPKELIQRLLENTSFPYDEPVVYTGNSILWDPFDEACLQDIYTHLLESYS